MADRKHDTPTVRCAIYTRKSTEEGLKQEFNSLDAQREAAEAYITSQRGQGWVCIQDRYDDGGFTGGNMERPALKRLMADIDAGRVDCIVVYKVDRLSRSLLDFARQSKPIKKPRQINKIVADSITLTRKQAAFEDITIISNLSEDLPLVSVDKDQIQQALINLSLNAIEAMKKGGKIIFTTRLSSPRDAIEILISDTGEGIPEENLNTIFEPFFTTKETGTGLGLAITFGLIKQHGGTIEVENRVGERGTFAILGEGSTFTIRLPIDREGRNAD